jgi:hypothetical protein
MLTQDGDEMSLTTDAESVCADLVRLGAVPTSGHRSVAGQARAMAVNVVQRRNFIGKTYRHGQALQALVDAHPEWVTVERIGEELFQAMTLNPELARAISHHLLLPCPCVDLQPSSVNAQVREAIESYQREGVIVVVLWEEGGLPKCHLECATLSNIKVVEV